MNKRVMTSELAGAWYSDDPVRLTHEIRAYMEAADRIAVPNVIALILPHAGYRYSGMVAACGLKQVEGRTFERVIILGPSHRVGLMDAVSIPDVTHIETPLGEVELDTTFIAALRKNAAFLSYEAAHRSEHSVQIQLPLLQHVLGGFKAVPIVCGQLEEQSAREIAATLLEHSDNKTLLVVSSDFTHYGRSFDYVPFDDDIQEKLEQLDLEAFRLIEQKNLPGFLAYIQNTGATICGRSPIAVLLAMLSENTQVRLIKYDTSGNMTGDWAHTVSYVSAAISGQWKTCCEKGDGCPCVLSDSDKIGLLRLARYQITRKLMPELPALELARSPAMEGVMGAFVTLHENGMLRGCIGEIFPRRALFDAVKEQALHAAFKDPRFPPVEGRELGDISIEISALTAPHKVKSPADIEIGKHGIVLYKGTHSAVFLPQVAPEQGWGLEETLTHLSLKAGLPSDGWQTGCEFQIFEAIVFSEH